MRIALSFIIVMLISGLAYAGSVQVVSTDPANGEVEVAPTLTEVRVTFSEPMRQDSYSFVINNDKRFPALSGDPYWEDETTCALPVVLEPETEYSMLINGGQYWNFVSASSGQPAESFELTFTTGKGN